METTLYVITDGKCFYAASVNDWFFHLNQHCIYFGDLEIEVALTLAKQSHPKARIVKYKIVPA